MIQPIERDLTHNLDHPDVCVYTPTGLWGVSLFTNVGMIQTIERDQTTIEIFHSYDDKFLHHMSDNYVDQTF